LNARELARRQLARLRDALPRSHARTSFAQEGEDLILERIFEHRATGIYVDVGAHHPRRFSNTMLLSRRGWTGINIDAAPGSMAAFRRERPRDLNLEMGVAATDEVRTFYVFDEPALNTFDAARAQALAKPPYRIVARPQIRCAPLATILREHRIGAIDLLTIDAEGYDFEILKTVDWDATRPHVVLTEQFARDLEAHLGSAPHTYLSDRGYVLVAKTVNSLCYVRSRA
jgi:FkbM family methyltransferase